jgi:hypothetical protein
MWVLATKTLSAPLLVQAATPFPKTCVFVGHCRRSNAVGNRGKGLVQLRSRRLAWTVTIDCGCGPLLAGELHQKTPCGLARKGRKVVSLHPFQWDSRLHHLLCPSGRPLLILALGPFASHVVH